MFTITHEGTKTTSIKSMQQTYLYATFTVSTRYAASCAIRYTVIRSTLLAQPECCNAVLEEILTLVYKRTAWARNHPTHQVFSAEDSRQKTKKMKSVGPVTSWIVKWKVNCEIGLTGKLSFQFVVLALIAAACAAPQQNPQDVQIVRYDVNNAGIDSYNFA